MSRGSKSFPRRSEEGFKWLLREAKRGPRASKESRDAAKSRKRAARGRKRSVRGPGGLLAARAGKMVIFQ